MDVWTTLLDAFEAALPASYLALVVLVAVVSQLVAWQLKVPSILVLLLVGFGLGQAGTADQVLGRELLFAGVSLTVGIILFEGGLGLKYSQIRELGTSVRRLCSVTVLLAWVLNAVAAMVVGFDIRIALLFGALLVVTGPTVINPILRQLRPTRRVASLLRWEGIVVDPIGAVLATLVFAAVVSSANQAVIAVVARLAATVALSFGLGIAIGWLLSQLMRRRLIPDFLQGVFFLGIALAAYAFSNMVQSESGLATVTVLGVYLANQPRINLTRVREFKEHLQVLLVGSLFVLLGGRVSLEALAEALPRAIVFLTLLVVVVRPISVYLPLLGTETTMRERTLLAFMAPRGIVAASVASIFALEFHHVVEQSDSHDVGSAGGLADLAAQADQMVPVVFLVIVGTVAIYGLGVGRLAERLGLASATPQGVLFGGAPEWAVQVAGHLNDLDIPARMISRDFSAVRRARMAGIAVEFTYVLSEYAVEEMDIAGLGSFIAALPDDTTNSTASREFAMSFGSANSYHLALTETEDTGSERRQTADHLQGRVCFQPPSTHAELERKVAAGMVVRRTQLTEEFTLADFRDQHGPDAVVMFLYAEGRLTVVTRSTELPETGVTIIALVPARPATKASASKDRQSVDEVE